MVGMRDVARAAGVSISTVSLVVNGTGYVSDEMKARVHSAMEDLDYIPNELARNLYRNRTDIIGVIVPTIRHPFFATLTASLQRVLYQHGFRTILCSTVDVNQDVDQYVDMLRRHMMDGIIMGAHTTYPASYWTSIGRPLVAFDRYLGPGIPVVASDHEGGGRSVADILLSSKARHVVMIGGPREQFHDMPRAGSKRGRSAKSLTDPIQPGGGGLDTTFPTVRYYLTLEHALDQAEVRYEYVEAGAVESLEGYARAVNHVLDSYDDVDAVVSSDIGAAYCVQEAIRRGIRIPDDLQVIAYDGTYLADAAGMRLTALQQNFDRIAELLGRRIIESIEADEKRDNARRSGRSSGGGRTQTGGSGRECRDRGAYSAARRGGQIGVSEGEDPHAGPDSVAESAMDGNRFVHTVADVIPLHVRIGETTKTN